MRSRVDQLGVSEPQIQTSGGNQISVGLPDVHDINRAEAGGRATTAELYFYDWEANALTPNGKTVASQLLTQDSTALQISQGAGAGPGVPGAGSMSLYQAVKLAAKQPAAPFSNHLSRIGTPVLPVRRAGQRRLRGRRQGQRDDADPGPALPARRPGQRALRAPPRRSQDLAAQLPPGERLRRARCSPSPRAPWCSRPPTRAPASQIKFSSPSAQFFVLKDNVALTGKDITNPTQGTDQAGAPDVQFGFTGPGASAIPDGHRRRSPTAALNVSLGG